MAQSFAITLKNASTIPMQDGSVIAKDPVQADDNGHAEVVFVVTNTTDRPARALAKIVPQGETKQEWLSIKGENERDFASRTRQEFTVSFDRPVSKPASAKPADTTAPATGTPATPVVNKYPFRFDVASPLNPQEDFTRGPIVTVEVTDKPPVPPPSRLWILFVILGAVLLIGIVVLVIWLINGDTDTNANQSPTPTPIESPVESPTETPTATPSPTSVDHAAIEKQCFDLVQGKISWVAGNPNATGWSPSNIENLCRGTTNAIEPPDCFQRVMHGGVPWDGGRPWVWQDASKLCAGTNDADQTISCYRERFAKGSGGKLAIERCKSR